MSMCYHYHRNAQTYAEEYQRTLDKAASRVCQRMCDVLNDRQVDPMVSESAYFTDFMRAVKQASNIETADFSMFNYFSTWNGERFETYLVFNRGDMDRVTTNRHYDLEIADEPVGEYLYILRDDATGELYENFAVDISDFGNVWFQSDLGFGRLYSAEYRYNGDELERVQAFMALELKDPTTLGRSHLTTQARDLANQLARAYDRRQPITDFEENETPEADVLTYNETIDFELAALYARGRPVEDVHEESIAFAAATTFMLSKLLKGVHEDAWKEMYLDADAERVTSVEELDEGVVVHFSGDANKFVFLFNEADGFSFDWE